MSNFANCLNQVHIVSHYFQIVSFVDLTFNLETLFERVHRVLQILFLVFVLLLNVLVDILIASLLVFDESVEQFIDSHFQLLVIIDARDHLEYCILEILDNLVVVSDNVRICSNSFEDARLSDAQVFHHEAKACIHFVILLQSLVHGFCPIAQILDLLFFRCNITSQVLNLFI